MDSIIPVIIPAYNPDQRLIELLRKLSGRQISPVIIVDDGSDGTCQHIFDMCGQVFHVVVLRHDVNRGKGRALKTAFSYCLSHIEGLTGCVTADADGQHTPEAILACRDELRQKPLSLILGARDFSGNDVPPKSRFGNQLTRNVFRLLYGRDLTDTQTGLRGIPADYMRELLDLPGERFEFETRMLADAVEKNRPIAEVRIETVYDSRENHSTNFRPIIDSVKIYMVFGGAFIRFLLSSLSSSVVDLVLFQLLCGILRSPENGTGYAAIATVAARTVSAVYNYLVNYFFVFRSKKKHSQSALHYFALAAVQMACSAALTAAGLYFIRTDLELLVKIPVDIFLFFISFVLQKRYVY